MYSVIGRVVIFGATGLVGHGALGACLDDPGVKEVVVVGRRPTGRSHPKLREVQHGDFLDYSAVEAQLTGLDACLWCLGISAAGMDEADYRRVTQALPLAAASTLRRLNPKISFVYVSGMGADREASAMWARVKAETEDALAELPLERALSVRPGGVVPVEGARSTSTSYRVAHAALGWLMRLLVPVFRGQLITTREIGDSMLALLRSGRTRGTLESAEMAALLG